MLETIEAKGGYKKLYDESATRAKGVRKALEAIGLHIYPKSPATSMTTIDDKNAKEIRDLLKTKYGVNVAGGQDHLKGKIFRINQMGLIEDYEMSWVLNGIELALDELGRRPFDGTAAKTYIDVKYKR